MGWSIGYSHKQQRDIGYGVPAICDHPDCDAEIHRGMAYACGGEHDGGEDGCGLYFCHDHLYIGGDDKPQLCERCCDDEPEFEPSPDCEEWIEWKLSDESWQQWRDENPEQVQQMKAVLLAH